VAAAREDHARPVVDELVAAGHRAEAAALDVTDATAVSSTVADVLDRFGRLDILVNNAGITRDQLTLRMKRDDWDTVLATNLTAAFTCAQAVLRPMIKQRSGRIVNITSVVGQAGNAGQANYAASKAGLIGLTRAMAVTYAPEGIRCNTVAPGLVATPMSARAQTDPRIRARLPELQPLTGDFGAPEDVARACLYLATAPFVTGAVLTVDGGWTAR
jgi:3-oxoacyl-[acyl-carrier protein] reductase